MSNRPDASERGAVTAELAMALPLLLAVTVGLVWLLSIGLAQVRTVDAAREVARALARGEEQSVAVGLGESIAPDGVTFTITRVGERITVHAHGKASGPGGLLPFVSGATLSAQATALAEPGEAGAGPAPLAEPGEAGAGPAPRPRARAGSLRLLGGERQLGDADLRVLRSTAEAGDRVLLSTLSPGGPGGPDGPGRGAGR